MKDMQHRGSTEARDPTQDRPGEFAKGDGNRGDSDRVATLQRALLLACDRIADGPQQYHEANTAEGWAEVFTDAATSGRTVEQVIADRPAPRKMTDAERTAMLTST